MGALPMKKAMKAAGATKKANVMKKAMKAKRVSKIAKGSRAKSSVYSGRKGKTVGGLTKADLIKSKTGKVVSKKASATSAIKKWADAVKAARKALGLTGFVAIGGKTGPGRALYSKAKSLMA